jgi:hypothetical protein
MFELAVFMIFGDADLQPWAVETKEENQIDPLSSLLE